MSNYLKGLFDGEKMYRHQIEIGRSIDQLQAINIVRMFKKFNTIEKPDYWKGYLDALQHHSLLTEQNISIYETQSEFEAA